MGDPLWGVMVQERDAEISRLRAEVERLDAMMRSMHSGKECEAQAHKLVAALARADAAEAREKVLREALKQVEWSNSGKCPACDAKWHPAEWSRVHMNDCWLRAALGKGES